MTKALAVLAAVAFGLSLSMSDSRFGLAEERERIRREGAVQGLPR